MLTHGMANVLIPGNIFPLEMGQHGFHVPGQVQSHPGGHPTTPAGGPGMKGKAQKGPYGLRGRAWQEIGKINSQSISILAG